MMNDMYAAACFARHTDHKRDRLVFRFSRTRAEERVVSPGVESSYCSCSPFDRFRHFCVNKKNRVQASQLGHCNSQVVLNNVRKLIDSRVDQKTLKSSNTSFDQPRKLTGISRNDATPKCNINRAFTL